MASPVSAVLGRLTPLSVDEYFFAFGPGDRFLYGTPNGYAANNLPATIISDLEIGQFEKITWASFGDQPESWFVVYLAKGHCFYRWGDGVPSLLTAYLGYLFSNGGAWVPGSLKVAFGSSGSYVAWTENSFNYDNIPPQLENVLRNWNRNRPWAKVQQRAPPETISWTQDGTFIVCTYSRPGPPVRKWHFENCHIKQRFAHFWEMDSITFDSLSPDYVIFSALTHAIINPHATYDHPETIFIQQADLIYKGPLLCQVHVASSMQEEIRLEEDVPPSIPKAEAQDSAPEVKNTYSTGKDQVKIAQALVSGRPHANEARELKLRKDEWLTVLEEKGIWWVIARDPRGATGWVHTSYIQILPGMKEEPTRAYSAWKETVIRAFQQGNMTEFPELPITGICELQSCIASKQEPEANNPCVHEVEQLLRGSNDYCYDLLKEERIKWHPDKFGRHCHEEHRERLRKKAEVMFVMIGMLMDKQAKHEKIV